MKSGPGADKTIQFYLPYQKDGVYDLPDKIEDYWPWISKHREFGEGQYNWTLQTFIYLKEAGIPCVLVHSFPMEGIVVSHRDFLPVSLRPRSEVFLVCIKPDRKEHTWAHYYIVQNKNDKIFTGFHRNRARAILHWPQSSLIMRNNKRGDKCENIAYFGRMTNLAKELQTETWKVQIEELGFNWPIAPMEQWNDYSNIDISVSIRQFGQNIDKENPIFDNDSKPPSKLINSWFAGVPAIVGRESAYQNLRESSLDFIEVNTEDELKEALLELRQNKQLYKDMVANGLRRSKEFSVNEVVRQWRDIIQTEIIIRYEKWRKLSRLKKIYLNYLHTFAYFINKRNIIDLKNVVINEISKKLHAK